MLCRNYRLICLISSLAAPVSSRASDPTAMNWKPSAMRRLISSGVEAMVPAAIFARFAAASTFYAAASTCGCVTCPSRPIDPDRSNSPTKTTSTPRTETISSIFSTARMSSIRRIARISWFATLA